ncbi:epoxyqueuosine reductase [Halarsenatibacter silvermanii]|uniref:Epoxyqueuosine reductase QueG (Queuosine biosynthesis) n=1 Tax=Halarsenatibacter silvermanii TaxID=321763 RepID=A0A1G9S3H5_9FIRM|nr:epoxyqueuosine reductase [Halarsenatibacter silvermanii]SDM29295.1 hypothetical protein SAMN04488692_12512 [Halarsenatibacter silvermanii]
MSNSQNSLKGKLFTVIEEETENYARRSEVSTQWRQPLMAAASAQDDYFPRLKEVVIEDHMLPRDLLAGAETVICYFLPFAAEIPASNIGGDLPSRAWAQACSETNSLIGHLNEKLKQEIEARGGRANFAAATGNFYRAELVSSWSHKHAAFIAGLGTFGRHHMLITESGCAGRIGSLVTDLKMKVDSRPESEFCLDRAGKECRECVENCEFSALTAEGLNKEACYQVLKNNADYFNSDELKSCGKCAVNLPCTLTSPGKEMSGGGIG